MIDPKFTVALLNKKFNTKMARHLGIEFTEVGKDYLKATMPVDDRTKQPLGLLHGGANAVLAESLGSVAAYLTLDHERYYSVGLEIKCNHTRAVTSGRVTGITKPIHIGKRTHVWQIEIFNDQNKLSCYSTITMAILPLTEEMKKEHGPNFREHET